MAYAVNLLSLCVKTIAAVDAKKLKSKVEVNHFHFFITTTMKTTVIVNDLTELIAVATFAGVEINVAEISVSFPYPFEIDHEIEIGENEEMTFDEFKSKYLIYE